MSPNLAHERREHLRFSRPKESAKQDVSIASMLTPYSHQDIHSIQVELRVRQRLKNESIDIQCTLANYDTWPNGTHVIQITLAKDNLSRDHQ